MDSLVKTTEVVEETAEVPEAEVDAWLMLRDVILPTRLGTPVTK